MSNNLYPAGTRVRVNDTPWSGEPDAPPHPAVGCTGVVRVAGGPGQAGLHYLVELDFIPLCLHPDVISYFTDGWCYGILAAEFEDGQLDFVAACGWEHAREACLDRYQAHPYGDYVERPRRVVITPTGFYTVPVPANG